MSKTTFIVLASVLAADACYCLWRAFHPIRIGNHDRRPD